MMLPLNVVYTFNDLEDKLNILNHLILTCIERHAPLKRVKLTHPIVPWMMEPKISQNKILFEMSREKARDSTLRGEYKEQKKPYKKFVLKKRKTTITIIEKPKNYLDDN